MARAKHLHFLLYGVLFVCFGLTVYLIGVVFAVPVQLVAGRTGYRIINAMVWYSGVPLVIGFGFILFDLLVLLGGKRSTRDTVRCDTVRRDGLVVVLTAYNDEESITAAVQDFQSHPAVSQVIVVSNNSADATMERAEAAGAHAIDEPKQGYGQCVWRCLSEGVATDAALIVLCEGDRTFRSYDIDKLLSYIPHVDIVNGTRTVEKLRARATQLSTFMYYGNLFVGKLLEAKHLGQSTITDVGTTYKLCRRDALLRLLPALDKRVNLEFNAHFLDMALAQGLDLVECPITFHPRVGDSKGGNVNNRRALRVGLRMIRGVVFGWKRLAT